MTNRDIVLQKSNGSPNLS